MPTLPLAEIQGFILRSYGMDALRLFVLRVDNAAAARAIVGKLPVTNSAVWARKPDFCLNLAVTYEGLTALGVPPQSLHSFPQEFAQGAVARAEMTRDVGPSSPANWKQPLAGPGVHVLVLLFAQNKDIL